jgi:hypothetical protein
MVIEGVLVTEEKQKKKTNCDERGRRSPLGTR